MTILPRNKLHVRFKRYYMLDPRSVSALSGMSFSYWLRYSRDQLPVGLIAYLVEHWTGIAEVMGSSPVRA